MRISKWVDMGQEVEIEIGADDIRLALAEAFATTSGGVLGEVPTKHDVTRSLNSIGAYLNAMTEEHIAKLSAGERKIIGEFLAKNAARFQHAEAIPDHPEEEHETSGSNNRRASSCANGVDALDNIAALSSAKAVVEAIPAVSAQPSYPKETLGHCELGGHDGDPPHTKKAHCVNWKPRESELESAQKGEEK